jgi:exodeoxyribonuclease VII large subunit
VQRADGGVVRGTDDLSGATPVHVTLGAGTATGTLEPDGPGPDGS